MNLDPTLLPLPATEITSGHRRRHRIGNLDLAHRDSTGFLEAAHALRAGAPVPGPDAIATAARNLRRQFGGNRLAPCIRLRRRCLAVLRAIASEPDWPLVPAQRECITRLLAYAGRRDRLIPDAEPVVGGLDAALLVDLAWPGLRGAIADYLDFRRLRAEEAALQGLRPRAVRFDATQWQVVRAAERALIAHVRGSGLSHYAVPSAPALFFVH